MCATHGTRRANGSVSVSVPVPVSHDGMQRVVMSNRLLAELGLDGASRATHWTLSSTPRKLLRRKTNAIAVMLARRPLLAVDGWSAL